MRVNLFKMLRGLLDLFRFKILKVLGLKRGHIYLTTENKMKERLILIII